VNVLLLYRPASGGVETSLLGENPATNRRPCVLPCHHSLEMGLIALKSARRDHGADVGGSSWGLRQGIAP
jgi:hypothetical protein